jgi:hypothetical protein
MTSSRARMENLSGSGVAHVTSQGAGNNPQKAKVRPCPDEKSSTPAFTPIDRPKPGGLEVSPLGL